MGDLRLVAENGAVVPFPSSGRAITLAAPPPTASSRSSGGSDGITTSDVLAMRIREVEQLQRLGRAFDPSALRQPIDERYAPVESV